MSLPIRKLLNKSDTSSLLSYIEGWKKGDIEFSDEDIKALVNCKNSKIRFETISAIFARYPFDKARNLLKAVFGVVPTGPPVYFSFPAVNESKGKLVEGLTFKSDKTFLFEELNIKVVRELVNSEFFFVSSEKFVGDSFQAPLAYALLYGGLPDDVVISGKLFPDGSFEADFKEEKEKLCRQNGKFLISKGNIHKLNNFLKENEHHLPFFMATGEVEENKKIFRYFCKSQGLTGFEGVLDEEILVLSLPNFIAHNEPWIDFFRKFKDKVIFLRNLSKHFSLHVALKTPITFSVGAGAVIGTGKIPVVIYHYDNGLYYKVVDLTVNSRRIKTRKNKLSFVELERVDFKGNGRAVISIQVASHETRTKGLEISKQLDADFFYIYTPNLKGNLPLDLDWAEVVCEIYEGINRIYDLGYGEFHILMSVPNPIAFALGMAIGNYWNITVWSYFKSLKDYKPVFNLGDIENI